MPIGDRVGLLGPLRQQYCTWTKLRCILISKPFVTISLLGSKDGNSSFITAKSRRMMIPSFEKVILIGTSPIMVPNPPIPLSYLFAGGRIGNLISSSFWCQFHFSWLMKDLRLPPVSIVTPLNFRSSSTRTCLCIKWCLYLKPGHSGMLFIHLT